MPDKSQIWHNVTVIEIRYLLQSIVLGNSTEQKFVFFNMHNILKIQQAQTDVLYSYREG